MVHSAIETCKRVEFLIFGTKDLFHENFDYKLICKLYFDSLRVNIPIMENK